MNLKFSWVHDIGEVSPRQWNRLACALTTPFLEWEWLAALERNACVAEDTGWKPCHLLAMQDGQLVAAAPLYVKSHSWGEFVFDQQWAEVARHFGQNYYPKLVGMSPFSPILGYRFLMERELDQGKTCNAMMREIDAFCKKHKIAGSHFLHVDPTWVGDMESLGLGTWLHHSLIWKNRNYCSFDDYLAQFKSRQRKKIKRERRSVSEQGVDFRVIPASKAPAHFFTLMYNLYHDTCAKFSHWSHYLNLGFFEDLAKNFAHRIVFVAAFQPHEPQVPVALSFLVHKGDQLFGRYWGCREHLDHLHFETCYYQPIQWAIQQGIAFFDAGSGNAEHKKRRGFPASENRSLHRFYGKVMNEIWDQNIDQVNRVEARRIEFINQKLSRASHDGPAGS